MFRTLGTEELRGAETAFAMKISDAPSSIVPMLSRITCRWNGLCASASSSSASSSEDERQSTLDSLRSDLFRVSLLLFLDNLPRAVVGDPTLGGVALVLLRSQSLKKELNRLAPGVNKGLVLRSSGVAFFACSGAGDSISVRLEALEVPLIPFDCMLTRLLLPRE